MGTYYAVAKGRKTGVFSSWAEASAYVDGFSGATHKKFNNLEEAEEFVLMGVGYNTPSKFYAIVLPDRGFVAIDWSTAKRATNGVSGSICKRFDTLDKAEAFLATAKKARSSVVQTEKTQEDDVVRELSLKFEATISL